MTLVIAISDQRNGSMSKAANTAIIEANRFEFLHSQKITPSQTILVKLLYEGDDYCRYQTVTRKNAGDGMVSESTIVADALFTQENNIALFLPIADCIAATLYDAKNNVLGLAHLGRHNLERSGGASVIGYMKSDFKTQPPDLKIWLSPAAGGGAYPLYKFNDSSLHETAFSQLCAAGALSANISVDTRDTTKDHTFFSHSEFLKGNRESDGRQAVVAMMRE